MPFRHQIADTMALPLTDSRSTSFRPAIERVVALVSSVRSRRSIALQEVVTATAIINSPDPAPPRRMSLTFRR